MLCSMCRVPVFSLCLGHRGVLTYPSLTDKITVNTTPLVVLQGVADAKCHVRVLLYTTNTLTSNVLTKKPRLEVNHALLQEIM